MTDDQFNHRWRQLACHFLAWRWLKVSLLVGTILNLINQFDAIFGGGAIAWAKVALTYCVPYGVASLSAWHALQHTEQTQPPRSWSVDTEKPCPRCVISESARDFQAYTAGNPAYRTPPPAFHATGRRSAELCD